MLLELLEVKKRKLDVEKEELELKQEMLEMDVEKEQEVKLEK